MRYGALELALAGTGTGTDLDGCGPGGAVGITPHPGVGVLHPEHGVSLQQGAA